MEAFDRHQEKPVIFLLSFEIMLDFFYLSL